MPGQRRVGLGRHLVLLMACVSVVLEVPAMGWGLLGKRSVEDTNQMNL